MINRSFLYIISWCIYHMQGGFLPRGLPAMKILCFVLLLISFRHFIIVNLRFKLPQYFIGLNILIGMFLFYGLLSLVGVTTHPLSEEYLKSILISLLPIYSFFYFSKSQLISEKNIAQFIVVFFVFAILKFYGVIYSKSMFDFSREVDFTNNAGYLFLPLVAACVFLYKKRVLQYLLLCICLIASIESSKRGAIVTCFVALGWFLINYLKGKSLKMKLSVALIFLLFCSIGYMTFERHFSESYAFQRKIEDLQEGGGSGRDNLYLMLSNYFFYETTPLHFIFGSGANATVSISTQYAHNDWLEIAVNQGVFGLMIYLLYWIMFFRECRNKSLSPHTKLALQIIFIICFMRTIFSMSYGSMATSATFILGYCLAQEKIDA